MALTGALHWQDLGPERCEVPCRWAVDERELARADMILGMASSSPSEIQGLQRRHPAQTVALFSMEPIWGCACSNATMIFHCCR